MTMETRLALTRTRHVVNAVDAKSRESWTVQAENRYQAIFELARQLGFDLEE